jgi:hypothetical protein
MNSKTTETRMTLADIATEIEQLERLIQSAVLVDDDYLTAQARWRELRRSLLEDRELALAEDAKEEVA